MEPGNMRLYILPIIFACLIGNAFAGADPDYRDPFAFFQSLSLEGPDVILQDKVRLPNGNWDRLLNSNLNNKEEKNPYHPQKPLSCSVPLQTLNEYSLEKGGGPPDAIALYCDTDRIWFASRAYCGEGDDTNNESGQADLHSYDIYTGAVTTYEGFLPRCQSISSATRIGNELWATTYFQGEYGTGGGSGILVLDASTGKAKSPASEIKNHKFTEPALSSIVYQQESGMVWVSTVGGIDRYSIKDRKWEQRYFDISITPKNSIQLILVPTPPTQKQLWLDYHLFFYPVDDPRGFAKAWEGISLYDQSGMMKYGIPVVHNALLPYYISALEKMDDKWNDYAFTSMLGTIAAHKGRDDRINPLLNKLLATPMSLKRRNAVVQVANRFGISNSRQLMDEQFETLLADYFDRPRQDGVGQRLHSMCEFAFQHTQYLPRLNEYYMTHAIRDAYVDHSFLDDCVRAYSMWESHSALMPIVFKALNEQKLDKDWGRYNLSSMCSIFNHYAKPDYRQSKFVFPILKARKLLEPYSSDKFLQNCIPASYWIANSANNIDELLAGIDVNPDLTPFAIDALHQVSGKNFDSIPDWRTWWNQNRKLFRPSKKEFYRN
jgi:hypothetical protein